MAGVCYSNSGPEYPKIVASALKYNQANPKYGFIGDPFRPINGTPVAQARTTSITPGTFNPLISPAPAPTAAQNYTGLKYYGYLVYGNEW